MKRRGFLKFLAAAIAIAVKPPTKRNKLTPKCDRIEYYYQKCLEEIRTEEDSRTFGQ